MRRKTALATIGVFILLLTMAAVASPPPAVQAARKLEAIRALAGDWEGANADGEVIMKITIRPFADGQSVLETQNHKGGHEMVTVYHLDGDDLVLTHYCMVGNQPRMRARGLSDEKRLRFDFAGASNLESDDTGHMHNLEIRFQDQDHFTQEWTWRENGEEKPNVIHFARR